MNAIQTIEVKGKTINIFNDDVADPRKEYDHLGKMVCWHRRYTMGDSHTWDSPEDFNADIKSNKNIILPLFMYDHGSISLSTSSFSCPWDSGQLGYIFVSKEVIRKEYKWQRLTKKRIKQIENNLKEEIKEYTYFINGEVYGLEILDEKEELVDSCYGFYGIDNCINYAKEIID